MIKRNLQLPKLTTETFFLWGPRQTGKTTLLREYYPDALWIDLLKNEEYRRYLDNPEFLRQEVEAGKIDVLVIDEIQKIPQLLDEVHWLIENRSTQCILCGSSARKVKRGHANLLGGRGLRYALSGFNSAELDNNFDLTRMLNHGYLPRIYLSDQPKALLNSYVADYLKEEIAAEGLVRNLSIFSNFLEMASLSDTEQINFTTMARDCGVSNNTVKNHFHILEDTLLGRWLPSFRKRPKRRVATSSKFYFFDVGIVNFLARRGTIEPGSALFGKALENWCFHELNTYNLYNDIFAELSFWKLTSGIEVDFIINDMEIAIEVKASKKIGKQHLKGLRSLQQEHPELQRLIILCLENKYRKTEDGIEVMPIQTFIQMLWDGELFR